MPNIKSAKKRVKVIEAKHESNIVPKGAMKTAVKKVRKEANTENLNIANKKQTIEAYNKIYGNEKLKEFIYKYWNDEKMVLTYPNLTLKLEDGKIMYVKDLTPEIKPYYHKFNERKIKK